MTIPAINESIVRRHAEDAAFLWCLRDRAVLSPRYTHDQMQLLDARVDAHLDGLRIAGAYGWACCVSQLRDWGEPDEVFSAAVLALDSDDASRLDLVLERVCGEPERERALVAATGWQPSARVEPSLNGWWSSSSPSLQRLGLRGLLAHRLDPGPGLATALEHGPDPLLGVAIRAAGALGRVDLLGSLRTCLDAPDHRLVAAQALARLGVDEAPVIEALIAGAEAEDEADAELAIDSLVRLAPELGRECYGRWRGRAGDQTRAIHAAVALGSPTVIDDLLEWMQDDALARLSGRAFSAVLGVDLEYEDLDRDGPPADPRTEDDDTIHVEDPRLHGLAWPSIFAASRWWRERSDRFHPELRYLAGEPIAEASGAPPSAAAYEHLLALTKRGRPWWRSLAARGLAQLNRALPLIETRAPTGNLHSVPGLAAWPTSRSGPTRSVQNVG